MEFYTFHDIFFFYNKIGNNFQACNNDMYISSYNWNVEMFAWFWSSAALTIFVVG